MCRKCWGPDAVCCVCGAEAREMYATMLFGLIPINREFYCDEHAAERVRIEMMRRTAPLN